MAHKLKWLAAAAGLLILFIALAPWTISGAAMRMQLSEQVTQMTGLTAEPAGRATFALLPRPRIKIEDVTIRDGDERLLIKSAFLRGNLRLLPMLAGRMEVSSIALASTRIELDLDDKPRTNTLARAERDASQRLAAQRLASLSLSDGTLHLRRGSEDIATLTQIEAALEWSGLSSPAGLRARFIHAGEKVDVSAWLGQPNKVIRGEASPISLRIEADALRLNADGIVTGGSAANYDGKLSLSTDSMRRLLERNGLELPLPSDGALTLSADAQATSRALQLSDLQFKLDGSNYEGALILSGHQGRLAVMGTLATRLLDLNALLDDVDFAAEADGRWSAARLPRRNFTRADIDLRISANRVQIGRVKLQDTGLSIQAANGKAEVTIAETRGYGGAMKARLSAARSEAGYDLRASAAFANLDSAAFFNEALRSQRISGTASGDIALAAEGASLAQITRSLRGTAQFQLSNGDVNGLDLEQALRRLEKRPLSIASEVRTGRTSISSARVEFEIVDGLATIRNFAAKAPGIEFDVAGSVSIARRLLDLSIRASQAGRESAEQAPQLSLGLKGNWDDPGLVIDARSLIRRSQAAAPLLRAPAKTGEKISEPPSSAAQ